MWLYNFRIELPILNHCGQVLRKKSFDLDQWTIMMPIAGPYTAAIILCDPSTECFLKKKKKYIHIRLVHVLLSRFYPDFILILSWFYLDFILILSRFYPDFIQIFWKLTLSKFYPDFILIFENIWIKSG